MSEDAQKFQVRVPRNLTNGQRVTVGEKVIDRIIERTRSGLDVNGRGFTGYSKSYKESIDFKIAGKSNTVNLTLTGDMLDSLEIIANVQSLITIGYPEGTEANDKAAWVQAGDNGPSRRFLGISQDEIDDIVASVRSDALDSNIRGLLRQANDDPNSDAGSSIGAFLRGLRGNRDEV